MNTLSHRRVFLLLIITPVLLMLELAIGFAVFSTIRDINTTEKKSAKLDAYLRANIRYIAIAESSQRGYLLTGDTRYRDTFAVCAVGIKKNELSYDTLQNELKSEAIEKIQATSAHRFAEMDQTIRIYDAGMKDSALNKVKLGVGKMMMDSVRSESFGILTEIADHIAAEREKEGRLFVSFFILIGVLILFSTSLVRYTYIKFTNYAKELETMVNSLEAANSRMREYTAMSYHDLKTPLRNIHGFAQLLKSRYGHANDEPTEEDEFIQYITDSIRQMEKTITQMREEYLDDPAHDRNKK